MSPLDRFVAELLADEPDLGERRLKEAHARAAFAEKVVEGVARRHGLVPDAILGRIKGKQRAHVLSARAHAVYVLREAGLTWPEIKRRLGLKSHTMAIRDHRAWRDHLAGAAKVSEVDAAAALRLMAAENLTTAQAAERLGLSPNRLTSRIAMMRRAEGSRR